MIKLNKIAALAALVLICNYGLAQPLKDNLEKSLTQEQGTGKEETRTDAPEPSDLQGAKKEQVQTRDTNKDTPKEKDPSAEIPDEFKKLMSNSKSEVEQANKESTLQKDAESLKAAEPYSAPGSQTTLTNSSSGTAPPSLDLTNTELILVTAIYGLLIIINFVVYLLVPRLRTATISIPFNLGGGSSAGRKWQQNLLEISLLFGLTWLYFAFNLKKYWTEQDSWLAMERGLGWFATLQVIYVLTRLVIAFRTRCPKCKVTFARKTLNVDMEPRATFQKTIPGTSTTKTWETGTKTYYYSCVNCSNDWVRKAPYERPLGS